jgi:hypothetical protein
MERAAHPESRNMKDAAITIVASRMIVDSAFAVLSLFRYEMAAFVTLSPQAPCPAKATL